MNSQASASPRTTKGQFVAGYQHSPATQFKKGQHWRPPALFREREYLHREYVERKRSCVDIASEHGVTVGAIHHWMRKHGIASRTMSQARAVKKWTVSGKANGMYGRTGKQNPRYVDGSSPERQSLYARHDWKEFVRSIYARDGFKCQRCGSPKKQKKGLHAHHIKPWAGNKNLRMEASNVVTLCRNCHSWVHSKANAAKEYLA